MSKTFVKHLFIALGLLFMLGAVPSCKSGKLDCPAYSDNPAPQGIPKGGKTKSGVFPPDMKRR